MTTPNALDGALSTFTFTVRAMPPDEGSDEPIYLPLHEGSVAVVLGTNAKPIGWIDLHETFAGRTYRDRILPTPPLPVEVEAEAVKPAGYIDGVIKSLHDAAEAVCVEYEKCPYDEVMVTIDREPIFVLTAVASEAIDALRITQSELERVQRERNEAVDKVLAEAVRLKSALATATAQLEQCRANTVNEIADKAAECASIYERFGGQQNQGAASALAQFAQDIRARSALSPTEER